MMHLQMEQDNASDATALATIPDGRSCSFFTMGDSIVILRDTIHTVYIPNTQTNHGTGGPHVRKICNIDSTHAVMLSFGRHCAIS